MRKTTLLAVPLVVLCGGERERASQGGTDPEPVERTGLAAALRDGRAAFDIRPLLIPPAGFPVSTDPIVEPADGHSVLIRSADSRQVSNLVEVSGVTPGHVYLYEIVAFNHPEHCRTGSTQFPEPSPCWSAGAANPVDGAIPEAGHFGAAFGAKVADSDRVQFAFDLMQDTPTEVFHGKGLTNPMGAGIAVGVLDKGPALPEGHALRAAQFNTIRGACEGPPSFGPLRCEFAGVQQHLSSGGS
jgi:hypothetical protein